MGHDLFFHVLAATDWQINTAFIKRVNLSIRQHVAAVGRRVATLCKGETGLRRQLTLHQVYYNFVRPVGRKRTSVLGQTAKPKALKLSSP
jgi:hypothetical protein